ncbi:hypothetical protein AOLI_G00137560 [Acnodon oligacanthus]
MAGGEDLLVERRGSLTAPTTGLQQCFEQLPAARQLLREEWQACLALEKAVQEHCCQRSWASTSYGRTHGAGRHATSKLSSYFCEGPEKKVERAIEEHSRSNGVWSRLEREL